MKLRADPHSLQWSQHVFPRTSGTENPTSSIASPSLNKRIKLNKIVSQIDMFGTYKLTKTTTSVSVNTSVSRGHTIRRPCSGSLDAAFDKEPSRNVEGLIHRFDLSADEENKEEYRKIRATCSVSKIHSRGEQSSLMHCRDSFMPSKLHFLEPMRFGTSPELPEWPEREAIRRMSIERKANFVGLPLSLRMLKKKQQWLEGCRDLDVSDSSSVARAFSSMVFIVLELQHHAFQMREVLCYEDLEGIIAKVRREIHASFLWLFQQVFSRTPALMVHVMILLANFCVCYTAHDIGIVNPSSLGVYETTIEKQSQQHPQIDLSEIKLFSVAGNSSGGGKVHPVAGGVEDGDGPLNISPMSIQYPSVVSDDVSLSVYREFSSPTEVSLWNSMVDEATKMQAGFRDVVLDHETMRWFVSPVNVQLEVDDYTDYFRTDLRYQMGLSQEPNNPLMLCNYAQFLHLVAHDFDRAEECFKRAIQVEPPDAECLSQYASFLWTVRKDLWGAEERYLQAVAAEPDNPYHASKYANFLWSTGGEETCFPLNASQLQ